MPRPLSESPDLHLERARDSVGGSRTAWCANYLWGGSARSRGGSEGGHRSQISLLGRQKYTKTVKKRVVLRMFWVVNRRKCRFLLKST